MLEYASALWLIAPIPKGRERTKERERVREDGVGAAFHKAPI